MHGGETFINMVQKGERRREGERGEGKGDKLFESDLWHRQKNPGNDKHKVDPQSSMAEALVITPGYSMSDVAWNIGRLDTSQKVVWYRCFEENTVLVTSMHCRRWCSFFCIVGNRHVKVIRQEGNWLHSEQALLKNLSRNRLYLTYVCSFLKGLMCINMHREGQTVSFKHKHIVAEVETHCVWVVTHWSWHHIYFVSKEECTRINEAWNGHQHRLLYLLIPFGTKIVLLSVYCHQPNLNVKSTFKIR